jgi:surface protein
VTRAGITRIDIVDSYAPTGKETASWDASVSKNGSVMCYVDSGVLTMAGNGSGEIWANEDSSKLFYNTATDNFGSLTHISGLDVLDTSNATTLFGAFARCASLISLDLSSWDVSNVESLAGTFNYCVSLETVDLTGWNTSKVTTMQSLFASTTEVGEMKLKNIFGIENWNVSNVTNMRGMLVYCTYLQTLNLSNWDTASCTNMLDMFHVLRRLRKITLGDKFSFTGNGSTSCTLYTPNSAYIRGADGNWYDRTGKAYAPSAIPSNTANTYFASPLMLKDGVGTGKTYLLHQVLNRLPAYARTRKYHWGA